MRLSKKYDNSWRKGNMLFILSLIIIIVGFFFDTGIWYLSILFEK